jgi:hypothetical protein
MATEVLSTEIARDFRDCRGIFEERGDRRV